MQMKVIATQTVGNIIHNAQGRLPTGLWDIYKAGFLPSVVREVTRLEFQYTNQMASKMTLQWHPQGQNLSTQSCPNQDIQPVTYPATQSGFRTTRWAINKTMR